MCRDQFNKLGHTDMRDPYHLLFYVYVYKYIYINIYMSQGYGESIIETTIFYYSIVHFFFKFILQIYVHMRWKGGANLCRLILLTLQI